MFFLFLITATLTLRSISSKESMSAGAGLPPALPFIPLLLFVIGDPHRKLERSGTCESRVGRPPLYFLTTTFAHKFDSIRIRHKFDTISYTL